MNNKKSKNFTEVNKITARLYLSHALRYKVSFIIMLLFVPLGALLMNTILPYYFSLAIGNLASSNAALVYNNVFWASVFGLIGVTLNYIGFQALTYQEASARLSLHNETFEKMLNKDMRFFTNEKVGAITSRFIDFIRSHSAIQDLLVLRTLGFILSLGSGLIIVASRSWPLAIIIAFLIVALLIQVKWSLMRRQKWRTIRKNIMGEINGALADAFTNNVIVKTFAAEDIELKEISKKNERFKNAFIKDIGYLGREGSIRLGIMVVIQIIAIGSCTYLVLNHQMDIAIAVFTLTYLQRISAQVFDLGSMINGYDQALLEAAPMTEMLMKENKVLDKPGAIKFKEINPTIEFKDVSYHYDDSKEEVLRNINLNIAAGEKIGLVGHSGAGKTTIAHLLLRFSDVTNGNIYIDNIDIRDISQKSLRQSIAYVPQEPMLFHRSLRENIAYGKLNATEKEIWKAAELASAAEFINKIPKGLDAIVGERGIKLSGGQRQRVAIARAILKDAPILVLDEATSALDSESERLIQDALGKLMIGRTSIVIAHRLSTIARMDRIIVLDDGKIVEEGTHQELLDRRGIYAKLWSHQSGGFIKD